MAEPASPFGPEHAVTDWRPWAVGAAVSALLAATVYHCLYSLLTPMLAGHNTAERALGRLCDQAITLALAVVLVGTAAQMARKHPREAWLAPWLWVLLPGLLKLPATMFDGGWQWWVIPFGSIIVAVMVVCLPIWPRRLAPRALCIGLILGISGSTTASLAAIRWSRDQVVVSGDCERLVRELAQRVGDDVAAHGLPPDCLADWQRERLRAPGWTTYEGGLEHGALLLCYRPPAAAASRWEVVFESWPNQRFFDPRARPFTARIHLDGAVEWSWPEGPPAAVQRRTAGLR